jgi:hypothetical protein
MSILSRSLPAFAACRRRGAEAQQWAVIDLSHRVEPEARLLIVTPSHGAQPPPA